jgi:hypothetical protein
MTSIQVPATTGTIPAARDAAERSWTEPGAFPPGSRPRSQYWDVANARWATRSPVPLPRRGD